MILLGNCVYCILLLYIDVFILLLNSTNIVRYFKKNLEIVFFLVSKGVF